MVIGPRADRLLLAPAPRARRAARAGALLAGLALAALPPTPGRAGTLSIDTRELPCPDPRAAADIEQRLGDLMAGQPDLHLRIRASSPRALTLTLEGPSGSTQRELAFEPADCPAIAHTVSLLVRGFLSRRWELPAAVAAPKPSEGPAREPVHAADAAPPAPAVERGEGPLRLLLLAGGFFAPGAGSTRAAGQLGMDWDLRPELGASLLFGLDGAVQGRSAQGQIAVSVYELLLAGRWTLETGERARIDLLAGAGLDVLAARSEGFSTDLSPSVGLFAAMLGARWRQTLLPGLSAVACVELLARQREEVFHVTHVGDVLSVSPWRARLLLGLAWAPD